MSKEYIENMGKYWNKRFESEDHVWGDKPSKTAEKAVKLFRGKN